MKRMRLTLLAVGIFIFSQAAQAAWEPAQRLTWNSGYSNNPAIAVDSSGHIHLVWQDYTPGNSEIYYKKSTDEGATWSSNRRLTWTTADSWAPDLAVDSSGNPHVVWQENLTENREIFYLRSTDGGDTWSASQRLTWNSGNSSIPNVAVDPSGNPHVSWHDKTPGNEEIYYKKSTDGGASWPAGQRLTWNAGVSGYPQIALASSTYLTVVWSDSTPGNRETYCKRSTDGGATWLASQRLSWNSGDTWTLALVVDSSKCYHLVWRDTTPGNSEVYYRKSTGGSVWSAIERLTWTSGECLALDISVGPSDIVHVVYDNDEAGNAEIYYKRGN